MEKKEIHNEFTTKDLPPNLVNSQPEISAAIARLMNVDDNQKVGNSYDTSFFGPTSIYRVLHFDHYRNTAEKLKTASVDTALVDLACGSNDQGKSVDAARTEAKNLGASHYIGVDKYNVTSQVLEENDEKLNGILIQGDMREVLKNLPDNSVNFTAFGIDESIISTLSNEAYLQEVKNLLYSKCKQGGYLITDRSTHKTLQLETWKGTLEDPLESEELLVHWKD